MYICLEFSNEWSKNEVTLEKDESKDDVIKDAYGTILTDGYTVKYY